MALPNVGPLIEDGQISVDVPARSFAVQALTFAKPLQSGAYLLGFFVEREGSHKLSYRRVFSSLRDPPELTADESRIGLNRAQADLTPKLRELGVGFVRLKTASGPLFRDSPVRDDAVRRTRR